MDEYGYQPSAEGFLSQVRKACRRYTSNSGISELYIAEEAERAARLDGVHYSRQEIMARASRFASTDSWPYYGHQYDYVPDKITWREWEQLRCATALREAIMHCVQQMNEVYLKGDDMVMMQCLNAYLDTNISTKVVRLSRSEYYRSLGRGIALLAYYLAEYFGRHSERYRIIAAKLKPVPDDRIHVRISAREEKVLRLAASGKVDTKTVAKHLGVSASTVETYWKRIRRKLGVRNRTEAITVAHQQGIIHLDQRGA
jgi:DNA-binding NarL/FixJ family response regulator